MKLIGTCLRAALKETGALRGLLILESKGGLRIAADARRRNETIVVRLRDQALAPSLLPESVLDYVRHTRESVVIDSPATRAKFGEDPYVRKVKAGSILCLPLMDQARLVGALFLENHLAPNVFTPPRIAVLKLVASLTASALEESRIYGEVQHRKATIRRLLDAKIIGIYIIDLGGAILESNDAYLRMLGYERKDLDSGLMRWTDLTPPEWQAADKERVERVRKFGRLQPFEKEFFRKDGTRVPVLMGVARFKKSRNEAIVFALDISKQKRAATIPSDSHMIKQVQTARRLHDALLQNLQGIMFRFQAARNLMIRHPDEALRSLNDAINEGEAVLDASRNAIQALRPERTAC